MQENKTNPISVGGRTKLPNHAPPKWRITDRTQKMGVLAVRKWGYRTASGKSSRLVGGGWKCNVLQPKAKKCGSGPGRQFTSGIAPRSYLHTFPSIPTV
jgi:hypothetical protein